MPHRKYALYDFQDECQYQIILERAQGPVVDYGPQGHYEPPVNPEKDPLDLEIERIIELCRPEPKK